MGADGRSPGCTVRRRPGARCPLHICVEAPEPSGERIAYDTIAALGSPLTDWAGVYIWPQKKRPLDENGRHGSLHAKCVVADGQMLFLSSANLTEYAMALNMELGVLIRGGPLSGRAAGYFQQLMVNGILVQVAV